MAYLEAAKANAIAHNVPAKKLTTCPTSIAVISATPYRAS
jgi:hypothetical protein